MSQSGKSLQSRFGEHFAPRRETQALPAHERILLIAKVAQRDPAALTTDEIQALANTMIMHYAQMGIG